MSGKTRSWWGWGNVEDAVTGEELRQLTGRVSSMLPSAELGAHEAPPVESFEVPASRVRPPAALQALTSEAPMDRLGHSHGRAFRDVVRALLGRLDFVPDLVVRPTSETEVAQVLDWCSDARIAVIPFGGGSSVVGGVEPRVGDGYAGAVSLDLGSMNRVLEIDATSRAALVQAGVLGPHLEEQLKPSGYTLRFFPQSFEFSTLGGWLATRAGGHFATVLTHIEDLTESLRVVTPAGLVESRRLPGSGAGPVAGPDVPRLRGDARRDHAGMDAPAGPAAVAGRSLRGVRRLRGRRTRGARPVPVRAPPGELPAPRPRRGTDQRRLRHRRRRPRLRVRGPSAHPVDGTRPGAVSRPRRCAARAGPIHRRGRRVCPRRRGRQMALGVPSDALPARRARRPRHDRRDLRDRVHLGPLPSASGQRSRPPPRTRCARWGSKEC